jgi:hypothetical protein
VLDHDAAVSHPAGMILVSWVTRRSRANRPSAGGLDHVQVDAVAEGVAGGPSTITLTGRL